MKIEMLICQAGADFVRNRGDVVEVETAEAGRMIAAGIAIPVREDPVETTVKRAKVEKAIR